MKLKGRFFGKLIQPRFENRSLAIQSTQFAKQAGQFEMSIRLPEQGYCCTCMANVEHVRAIRSPILRLLDQASFRLASVFGFGPWYCISCSTRRLLFPPHRRKASNYDPRVRVSKPIAEQEIEALGNVFLSTMSLIQRSERAGCYSEKFRDGVAEQLLSCDVTFSQVRQRLDVTDLDLQDWIARYHRKQLRDSASHALLVPMKAPWFSTANDTTAKT